jgi:hypothetical protein
MQCWYFGCAPGIMNRAAGRLSFDPFPATEDEFLLELAKPLWGETAPLAAEAWKLLGNGYRYFPENLFFKWFGPMHNAVATPWYLYPADLPVAPSYTQAFPKNSGDRFGEFFGYDHTLDEVCKLCRLMEDPMLKSVMLIKKAAKTPDQIKEAQLMEAITIQTSSMRRMLEFYQAREEMIYLRKDHKSLMHNLIADEIKDTLRLIELCKQDSRLGYHAEVESHLFFPEKLHVRAKLLQECDAEIDSFDYDADCLKEYRGETGEFFPLKSEADAETFDLGGTTGKIYRSENKFIIDFTKFAATARVEFEPARMMKIIEFTISEHKHDHGADWIEGLRITHENGGAKVEFDLNHFRSWRVDDSAPYRFNVSCGNAALKPLKPWPYRLLVGRASAEELLMVK